MTTKRIICICSGNICRSPMAVTLLRHKLKSRGISAIVISGGTLGISGRRAAKFARNAIKEKNPEMGSVIDEHRSQGLSPMMLDVADHLIVMAPKHEEFIRRKSPTSTDQIVRLWEYATDGLKLNKIPDPVGHDADVFRHCRNLIDECIEKWLEDSYHPS